MAAECRVAFFSSEYAPHILGGLGTHVHQVTTALADSVAFELFVPERGDYQASDPAIRIHEVPVGRGRGARSHVEFWLRFCEAAVQAARQLTAPVDLIHCHEWMTILAGIRLQATCQVPLVYNIHLPQATHPTLRLENLGLSRADLTLVNSQAVCQELVERDLPLRRIAVVPNGVDLAAFRPSSDWPADAGYLLFVGRLVPQKGVDLLLRAFGAVLRRCPEGRLVIVGDGDLELYLQRVAHYLGFPQRVAFVHWQSGPALVELYQGAQAVVMPSYYEPFGIVALEAMACGRPVIATRVGGLAEIIEDGVQGYLVPAGDHLQLAQRLVQVMVNPDLRRRMAAAARARAERFSWHVVGREILSLYQDLVRAGPAPFSEGSASWMQRSSTREVRATVSPS